MITPTLLQVLKLIYGPWALAEVCENNVSTGEKILLSGGLPGEIVLGIEQPQEKKRPRRFQVGSFLQANPHRTSPQCRVAEICGGCHWQHLALSEHGHWKTEILRETLIRLGGSSNPHVRDCLEPETEQDFWQYRNKIQWFWDAAQRKLGYYAEQSHQLVPFESCHLIPRLWNEIKIALEDSLPTDTALKSVILKRNTQDETLIAFETSSRAEDYDRVLKILRQQFGLLKGILRQRPDSEEIETLWGQNYLTESAFEYPLKVSFHSFFQIHVPQVLQVLNLLKADWPKQPVNHFMDVYGGVGLFATALSKQYQAGYILELSGSSCEDARENLKENGLFHLQIIEGDVKKTLNYPNLPKQWDITLLDPPRAGCHPDVLTHIALKTSQRIYYLSCDPTTLARDLKRLNSLGWSLKWAQPIDFFPQTYHIEVLCRLERMPT
jgi:23S rRNA (uracil1939-C5)-methyltransferase